MKRKGVEFSLMQVGAGLVEMAIPNRRNRHDRQDALEP